MWAASAVLCSNLDELSYHKKKKKKMRREGRAEKEKRRLFSSVKVDYRCGFCNAM